MLVIMSGISGSGKSHHSQSLVMDVYENCVRLSSDELRAVIGTGESDLKVSDKVFQVMGWMTDYLLKNKFNVIIDATMVNPKARAPFIAIARKHKVKVRVICVDTPLNVCKERNAARDRKVPAFVIDSQHGRIEWPTKQEVDEIEWVR